MVRKSIHRVANTLDGGNFECRTIRCALTQGFDMNPLALHRTLLPDVIVQCFHVYDPTFRIVFFALRSPIIIIIIVVAERVGIEGRWRT